jgi:hypothetical protein
MARLARHPAAKAWLVRPDCRLFCQLQTEQKNCSDILLMRPSGAACAKKTGRYELAPWLFGSCERRRPADGNPMHTSVADEQAPLSDCSQQRQDEQVVKRWFPKLSADRPVGLESRVLAVGDRGKRAMDGARPSQGRKP